MRRSWAALGVVALLVTACGDDASENGSGGEETAATSTTETLTTDAEGSSDDEERGSDGDGDVASFCQEYQSALATAENPASTEQFADLVPPEDIAAIWPDYLDSDFDAGLAVDEFITANCFE